ncbi:hypothetical protein ELUMI_v1c05200 [Williamsoniiplasma luminosum]|uniref:Uncharacterized protein n=1 Tax=Williamsoniiplasma luminosum TaxID=214888 RepID=A0A2K8NU00_9MOLU|nr:hypothetical protein [Williamsoniiplasma luminosum]ATZ17244.1 hypothetical protein ELUMI_v1c05200 [Williamsoniiplasma luminosum]
MPKKKRKKIYFCQEEWDKLEWSLKEIYSEFLVITNSLFEDSENLAKLKKIIEENVLIKHDLNSQELILLFDKISYIFIKINEMLKKQKNKLDPETISQIFQLFI